MASKKKAKAKKKPGRPTKRTAAIEDELVEWISSGQTLRDYCRQPGKPGWRTIYDWLAADEAFSARIARARDLGFDAIAMECLAIADNGENDWMEREGKDGSKSWQLNGEHVQRSRARIETRLKLLAKWDPKRYGDRMKHEHDGNVALTVLTGVPQPVEDAHPVDEE